ncbi:hypothetical protein GE21DRAFT_1304859 [Neurospora crassa]|nr:hypothetical protein 68B2.120 [imported] - Neurospora crassa [Neurospora crassa]KHE88887.1 hypothetical protein GE21DRAFT_1304859 [Neurospora crassa]
MHKVCLSSDTARSSYLLSRINTIGQTVRAALLSLSTYGCPGGGGEACPSGRERQGFGAARGAGGRCQAKGPGQWKPTHSPGQAGGIHARTGATVTRSQLSEVQAPFLWTSFPARPPCLPCDYNTTSKKPPRLCVCLLYPPRQQPRNSTSTSVFHFFLPSLLYNKQANNILSLVRIATIISTRDSVHYPS